MASSGNRAHAAIHAIAFIAVASLPYGDVRSQGVVDAQHIRKEATELANRLGREASIAGLQRLIALRDDALVRAYVYGFQQSKPATVSDDIAKIVLEHYREADLGALVEIPRSVHYHSRPLFDAMLAQVLATRPGSEAHYAAFAALMNADAAGIEGDMFTLAQDECNVAASSNHPTRKLTSSECTMLFRFLRGRNHPMLVAWLVTQLKDAPPMDEYGVAAIEHAASDPSEAVSPFVARLAFLSKHPSAAEAAKETSIILSRLAEFQPDVPIGYATLRAALSVEQRERNRGSLVAIIAKRKDGSGISDLLDFMEPRDPNDRVSIDSFNAIVNWPSPDLWRKALATAERIHAQGRLDDNRFDYVKRTLASRVARPDEAVENLRLDVRRNEYLQAVTRIGSIKSAAGTLRKSDPDRYVAEILRYCGELQRLNADYRDLPAVALRWSDLVNEYATIGTFHRFVLHDARSAIEMYRRAAEAMPPAAAPHSTLASSMASIAAADTLEFDINDKSAAAAQYDAALQSIRQSKTTLSSDMEPIARWLENWIATEVRFLREGRRFSGRVGREQAVGYFALMIFASPPYTPLQPESDVVATLTKSRLEKADPQLIATLLNRLPRSRTTLAAGAAYLGLLPNADAILSFLERNDPSGYWTAMIFAVRASFEQTAKEKGTPDRSLGWMFGVIDDGLQTMRLAAERYAAASGAQVSIDPPDPRKSTPEKTWQLFIASLRSADVEAALDCFVGVGRDTVKSFLPKLSRAEMKDLADSFGIFAVTMQSGDIAEAAVVRSKGADKQGGFANFVKVNGEWKIEGM